MNNWHFLLLALLAIFQPIESFTERNLVDGRRTCCGREPDFFRERSESSSYGPHQFTKDLPSIQRLTYRDETRENRRSELTQRENLYRSTEKSLPSNRHKNLDSSFSIRDSSTQGLYRPERVTNNENRDRRLVIQRRQRNVGNIRDTRYDDRNGRILSRIARYSAMRQVDRTNEFSARNRWVRDDSRISRFNNRYQVEDVRPINERMQARSEDLRRITLTRDIRDNLRQAREDVVRIYMLEVPATTDNRYHIRRERENTVSRKSLFRDDVRRYVDNNKEHRQQVRLVEERRALSGNSRVLERVNDVSMRVSSRNARWSRAVLDTEERLNRIVGNQNLVSKRIEEGRERNEFRQYREQSMETLERKFSDRRMPMDRRQIRENRNLNDIYIRTNRAIERRLGEKPSRETRGDRLAQDNRIDGRATRRTLSLERDNRVTDRRARTVEHYNYRDVITEADPKLRTSVEAVQRRDDARIHRQIEYQNKMESRVRDSIDTRSRNVAFTRTRGLVVDKIGKENEGINFNWQYIFYTIQGAYLCSLFMQLLTSNNSEKSNKQNLRWWPLTSQKLIKVD